MYRRRCLVRVTHRHRQLELAKRADGAPRAVGDLHRRVQVHVGAAEMADGEGVAAEVNGVVAVVHDELGAHWVVHARTKDIWLGGQQAPQTLAWVLVARRWDFEPLRQQGRGNQVHQALLGASWISRARLARSRKVYSF